MTAFFAALKFAQFIFWSLLLIPPQMIVLRFTHGDASYILPRLWHKMICRAFGITVETENIPAVDGAVLYVSNHLSYLDIPALSCVLRASFVAKADVADWPVFGLLAKLHQTVFVSRSKQDIETESLAIKNRLRQGSRLIIFPEGTSSDGAQVLPFKSSLFNFVLDEDIASSLTIQPFTIELTEADGKKITSQQDRDYYAWHGDMTLMPHFWQFAKLKGAKVKLHFHAPVKVKEGENRKELALRCHKMVAAPLAPFMAEAA